MIDIIDNQKNQMKFKTDTDYQDQKGDTCDFFFLFQGCSWCLCFWSVKSRKWSPVNLQTEIFDYEESALENADDYMVCCCRRGSIKKAKKKTKNTALQCWGSACHILICFLIKNLLSDATLQHTHPLWGCVKENRFDSFEKKKKKTSWDRMDDSRGIL